LGLGPSPSKYCARFYLVAPNQDRPQLGCFSTIELSSINISKNLFAMVVPRNNKWKFVSSAYNSEVENGKNDNSIAEQNNPDEIAAANKIPKRAFGNGNANNLFDEMRTLLAKIEQKQIEQAKVWRQRPKVFEKVQKKEEKVLTKKLSNETNGKQEIRRSRLAGSTHGIDGNKFGKYNWNLINGNEWKQFKLSMEDIVQRLAEQQNIINKKNINCDKNAKEAPMINKIISHSFIPSPNQQTISESPSNDGKTAENGQNLNQGKKFTIKNHFVPVEGTHFLIGRGRMVRQFKKFPLKIIPKMYIAWFGNGCMQLKWNYFPSVKSKQISPKMNTDWNGTGSMQLNWNFFPSVKPKCNKEQVIWHPPRPFRNFANFAKHDWSMIAKRTLEWNQPRCKEISRVEPLSEGEGM
jgi:hypothetical protein